MVILLQGPDDAMPFEGEEDGEEEKEIPTLRTSALNRSPRQEEAKRGSEQEAPRASSVGPDSHFS